MKKYLLFISLCFILIGIFLRKSDFWANLLTQRQNAIPIISQTGNKIQEIVETTWVSLETRFPEPLITTKTVHNVNIDSLYNIFNEEIPESMITRGSGEYDEFIKTAYQHTLSYPDLWLKITLHNSYTQTPNNERLKTLFSRTNNRLSTDQNEFITMYTKNPNTPLLSILQKTHLNSWCRASLEEEIFDDVISGNYNHEVYSIRPKSGSFDSRKIECYPDDENQEDYMTPIIYFESQDKTRYYKLRMNDGCAPWPCSLFAKIEAL